MSIPIQTVKTERFTMEYFRFGSGAKTLVILPGLSVQSVMGYADALAQAYALLTADFTVYVFDRRKEAPDPYTVHEMALDTAEAIRALGLERICLFGASQGGMIAMEIAIAFPGSVEKLVIGSSAACVTEERFRVAEEWVRLAKNANAAELYLSFGQAVYPHIVFEQSRALLLEAAKTVTADELRRFVILAEGMKGFDVTRELCKITCPVLVIGNEDDRVLGRDAAETICRQRPDFELHMYDGYGHASYDTAPDYKARISEFLL